MVSAIFVVIYYYLCFRKELKNSESLRGETVYPQPSEAIKSKKEFMASSFIFLAAVVLLVTHAQTGLTVAAIGVIVFTMLFSMFWLSIKWLVLSVWIDLKKELKK